jgi:predicted amidohydrolase
VIGPLNRIVAEGVETEEIIYAEIDLAMIGKVRKTLNALEDVRFGITRPSL